MRDEDAKSEAFIYGEATSNSQPNNSNEILEQLLPTVVAMHQMHQQILQYLMNTQTILAKEPTPTVEPIIDDLMPGVHL